MLNPVKYLAGSIIFITLSNVKQIKSKEYGKYKYNINRGFNALHGREDKKI
jgi:hypothetical protein